jgi:hypothetical protein
MSADTAGADGDNLGVSMTDPPPDVRPPAAPASVTPLVLAAPLAPAPRLAYATPLAAGQVRPHRPGDGSLAVDVGPLPAAAQARAAAPLAAVFGVLCVELAVVLWSMLWVPGAVPIDKLLVVPSALVWGFVGLELALQFRGRSAACRLEVAADGTFAFPYPTPRSRVEQVPAADVVRLGVVAARSRVLRRRRAVLRATLRQRATFDLLPGHSAATLEDVCDLLGPALGLDARESDARGGPPGDAPDSAGGRAPTAAG